MEVGNMAYLAVVVEAIIALAETGKRASLLPSLKKQLPRVKSKLRSAIQAGVEDGSLVKAIRGSRDSRRYGPLGSLLRTLVLIAKTYKLGSAGGKTSRSSVARGKKKPMVTVTRRKAEVVRASDSATAARRKSASKRKTRVSTSAKAPSTAVSNAGKKIAAVFWPGRRTGKSARKTACVKRAGKPATVVSRWTAAAAGKKRAAVARKKTVTKGRTVAKTKATTSKKVAKR
ncbi:expressed unknown protein [Ectocarpus siliculosus]|uniref:Uncharacterized protein n=1 Tax=Ectocarpus siliculosus TaxID=2880 RepID=D7FLX9_ECTSI|nr:expressed unknown protein [Ectocarpus siliculosus]|eukprot:CBJ29804.1 expressed unknown protein [Ectocarpus siliculosus]